MRAKAIATLTFLLLAVCIAGAATQKVLYTFTGGLDGGDPYAGVIFDRAGNLYGVTQTGGMYNRGTVFKLSPSPSAWTETVLYNFTGGPDGGEPIGGLVIDDSGYLYGTASAGGDPIYNCGTLFQMSPLHGGGWDFEVLHRFKGPENNDGCSPAAKLRYVDGGLWGTTVNGGSRYYGAAFVLDADGFWSVNSFLGRNGQWPWGGINNWSYGTTFTGGSHTEGKVYQVIWGIGFKVIHGFSLTGKPGYNPFGELLTSTVVGVRTMYGTTYAGGVGGGGTVYRLRESQTKPNVWLTNVLHSFSGQDGEGPGAGVIADAAGNLYGTTTYGGTDAGSAGTVFKLSPGVKNTWTHTILYSFTGGIDGGELTSGVIFDEVGNLYGITSSGGAYNKGVVYQIIP
jgi:uncharacterized repeat protein (TIGR03803 family)